MAEQSFEAKLAALKREVQRAWRPRVRRLARTRIGRAASNPDVWRQIRLGILKVTVVITLPFFVYVRASTYLYFQGASPWTSVAGGALLTMAVVAVYATWFSRRFAGRARASTMARWVAFPMVAAWCLYASVYLARANAKTDDIRGFYSAVHPVLRVALSTVILVDPEMVLTDTRRRLEDYARMGLPPNARTRHLPQPDGWVHAVDLRTRERGEIRNRAIQFYFWIMGFDTLRHVGTADHLHVQLALNR
jgi:hypothetical protein